MEADRDALADFIRHLRSTDPAATLNSLLLQLQLEKYPLLHGCSFKLAVGAGTQGFSVSLQAPGVTVQPSGGGRHG
jgi:hypothetical protein